MIRQTTTNHWTAPEQSGWLRRTWCSVRHPHAQARLLRGPMGSWYQAVCQECGARHDVA